jgi:hypothetical protein
MSRSSIVVGNGVALDDAEALRLFEENSRNFDAGSSESEDENQNSEDSQNPSTADSAAPIKQEPEETSQDNHVLDDGEFLTQSDPNVADMTAEARTNLDMSSFFPVEDTDTLSELESELSELSESELLRRFAQIDGADTQSQLSDLSDLSDNELLWRFERIDAAVIEDELAGMELLRIGEQFNGAELLQC